MNGKPLGTLPDPPDHLSNESHQTWMKAGVKLLRANRLTNKSLEKLSDLCYWEDQHLSVMQKLRQDQSAGVKTTNKAGRSIYLKNLRAVKQEIDELRDQLGLEKTDSDLISNTPVLPEEAFESLPPQLETCCSRISENDQKDLLLLSMIPLIASHLPNLLAEHADGYYTPSVNIFLLDGSGAGKQLAMKASVLAYGDLQTNPGDDDTIIQSLQEIINDFAGSRAFQKEMRTVVETDLDLLLTDNLDTVKKNGLKLMFECAFTPFPLVTRSGKGELSALLIGDIDQFKKLSLKTGSNLFTPFMLYSSHGESTWQSNRPNTTTRSLGKDLAGIVLDLARIKSILSGRKEPLTIELTSNQWQMIDDTFAEKMEIIDELGLPAELHAVNRNTAIYALKLSAIFTALRAFNGDSQSLGREYLTPAEDDVIAALWLADTCLKHAIRLHELQPANKEADARGERYLKYHNILPATFETAEAMELADKMNIPDRTAKRYLNALIVEKKVTRIKRGLYEKMG